MTYVIYSIGFFVFTLILQAIFHKARKNKNMQYPIWAGENVVVFIALSSIVARNTAFLGAVIGYVLADNIGKKLGWH
jgi:hypothetical protein